MTDASPSRLRRLVLRADSFTTSSSGTITLVVLLTALIATGTAAGYAAAVVLFAAWVAVGLTGRRLQRRRAAEDG